MKTEKILVTRSSMPPFEEYVEEIRGIWEDRWLTNFGKRHQELQERLKSFLGVKELTLFSNGHLALEAAIASFSLEGEVITTPYTFASTTHAIVRNGLTPVFCDIDEMTYCIDAKKIEELITPKTTAIVPVHVYGGICDVDKIQEIAQKHHLKVIYDGAHAFGVKKNGVGVGCFGDATMFSFHATKVFHTIEGGAVAYKNSDLGEILHEIQNFGFLSGDDAVWAGGNAKLSEFSAAMGLCNLRRIETSILSRKAVVERYRQNLKNHTGIILPAQQQGVETTYSYFPVRFIEDIFGEDRDSVSERLAEKNIFARKYFYPLTSAFSCYSGKCFVYDTPIAEKVSNSILCLPLYEELCLDDVDRICEIILENCKD